MREAMIARPGRSRPANLRDQVSNEKRWPTPNSRDWKDGKNGGNRKSPWLGVIAHRLPTPTTKGLCGGSGSNKMVMENHTLTAEEKRSMIAGNGGELNPDWVEWLMGWPVGFTDRKAPRMEWFDWSIDPADIGAVPRLTTRKDRRKKRLEAIGNGQVPLCAAVMFDWGLAVLEAIE